MKNFKIFSGFVLLIFTFTGCLNNQDQSSTSIKEETAHYPVSPDYPVPYNIPVEQEIIQLLERVRNYLDDATPMGMINDESGEVINDFELLDENSEFANGDFPIVSYEWGVTYAGMLQAGLVTGDTLFTEYTRERLNFLKIVADVYAARLEQNPESKNPLHKMLQPRSLDDAGSMCAAMIKSTRAGVNEGLEPYIKIAASYISNNEFRLDDGTLARQGPYPHTLWLDDLFMSVPALAQMGAFSGENKYFDDAAKQIIQFSDRMFNSEKGLFMHGWAREMDIHPEFHWARANGWAIMAIIELLEVLPEDYKDREHIISLLQEHIKGLSACQSGQGFWHQLLDRSDSYLETSATAIFTYSIARAINRGYADSKVYGAQVLLAWNALTTRINEKGQVEGTCVGTGMAFDPAFYYYRPQSALAAHGYGPILLAGSEIIQLLRSFEIKYFGGGVEVHSRKE